MTYSKLFKSAFLAGFLPVVAAPILWPFVVYLSHENSSEVSIEGLNYAFIPVTIFALFGGLVACVFVGFPVLVALNALKLNSTRMASFLGALSACLILGVFGPSLDQAPVTELWPVYLYFSLLGAGCGALASSLSNR